MPWAVIALRLRREEAGGARVDQSAAPFWLKVQLRLAQSYRRQGDLEKAQAVETELLELLAFADRDHPILLQIQSQQQLVAERKVSGVSQ